MKDADKLKAKKNIKSLLESLPKDYDSHVELLKMLDEMTGVMSSIFSLYNHARLAHSTAAGLKLASLYKEKGTTEILLKDLIKDGLFEEISNSKELRDKAVSLIKTFIEVSSSKSINSENIVKKIVELDKKKLFPIKTAIEEKEKDINRAIAKEDIDLNLERYKLLEELLELKEKEKSILKERESLTKNMGNLSLAMVHYYGIAKDLSNTELLNAILSQPTYQYKLLNDKNSEIKEDELGIFYYQGKLTLKANFEHKELDLRIKDTEHQGISVDLYNRISLALASNAELQFSQSDLQELSEFASFNNYPGIVKDSFSKLMNFIYTKPYSPNYNIKLKDTINGLSSALTQAHVVEKLSPLITEELIEDIFNLPLISPAIQDYHRLVHNLAEHKEEFQRLFSSLAKQTPEFKFYISELMNFIYTPEEDQKAISDNRNKMINKLMDLVTKPNVVDSLSPLVDQKLIDDIFTLPNISPKIKDYHKLVKDLAEGEDQEKFKGLLTTLIKENNEFKTYISDLMQYVYQEKVEGETAEQTANRTFDKSMISLIDAIKPEAIESLIPLINDKLIENVIALPQIQEVLRIYEKDEKANKWTLKTKSDIDQILNDEDLIKEFKAEFGEKIFDDLSKGKLPTEEKLKIANSQKLKKEKEKKPESSEMTPLTRKIIDMVKNLSKNKNSCEKICQATKDNKNSLTKAFNALIKSPAGKALDNFYLTGEEVSNFLPKAINEKGLNAIANYVENPSTWNLIQIFAKTNTLAFATKHYIMSLTPISLKSLLYNKNTEEEKPSEKVNELLYKRNNLIRKASRQQ